MEIERFTPPNNENCYFQAVEIQRQYVTKQKQSRKKNWELN